MSKEIKEYLLCAAIHFEDGNKYEHQPKNIESGIVVCGRRHHNCFIVMDRKFREGIKGVLTQGFLTSTDRFLDRIEAAQIAFEAGQISDPKFKLFSEDLY